MANVKPRLWQEVQVRDEDRELLITTDNPGEDTLEEDTFHDHSDNLTARRSGQTQQGGDPANQK